MRKTIEIKVSPEMWAERTLHDGYVAAYRVEGGINKEYKFMGVRIEGFSTLVLVFGSHEPGEDETRSPVITELCDDRQQWISVKDGLPASHEHVLITINKKGYKQFVRQSYYSAVLKTWGAIDERLKGEYSCEEVTHWMPLPSPPEVDDV